MPEVLGGIGDHHGRHDRLELGSTLAPEGAFAALKHNDPPPKTWRAYLQLGSASVHSCLRQALSRRAVGQASARRAQIDFTPAVGIALQKRRGKMMRRSARALAQGLWDPVLLLSVLLCMVCVAACVHERVCRGSSRRMTPSDGRCRGGVFVLFSEHVARDLTENRVQSSFCIPDLVGLRMS